MKTESKNQLSINSLICHFSDAQIRQAMDSIDSDEPLHFVLGLINGMSDYIIFNEGIDRQIRDTYLIMDRTLNFYLELIKTASGYEL